MNVLVVVTPLVVTLDTAADLLGCSRSTLDAVIRRGDLPTVAIGKTSGTTGSRKVRMADLDAYAANLSTLTP